MVDLTVAYPDQTDPLGLVAVMAGSRPPCNLYFYYRVYRSDEVGEMRRTVGCSKRLAANALPI